MMLTRQSRSAQTSTGRRLTSTGPLILKIRLHRPDHTMKVFGGNRRLDTLQAAILLEKLEIFDDEILRRQKVAQAYGSKFKQH